MPAGIPRLDMCVAVLSGCIAKSGDRCNLTTNPRRATLAASILGSSLAFIDGSVVNVALPALGRQLHADPMPNSRAILGGAFFGEERGRAIGTWAAVGAIAGVVGPLLVAAGLA